MPPITRRRLLTALLVAMLGTAGCSALGGGGSGVDSGDHQVVVNYRVSSDNHTLGVDVGGENNTTFVNESFDLSPEKRVSVAGFRGKPEEIRVAIDGGNVTPHQWPSTNCGGNETSVATVYYATAIAADRVNITGSCVPTRFVAGNTTPESAS